MKSAPVFKSTQCTICHRFSALSRTSKLPATTAAARSRAIAGEPGERDTVRRAEPCERTARAARPERGGVCINAATAAAATVAFFSALVLFFFFFALPFFFFRFVVDFFFFFRAPFFFEGVVASSSTAAIA